jgi:hypothetical protein
MNLQPRIQREPSSALFSPEYSADLLWKMYSKSEMVASKKLLTQSTVFLINGSTTKTCTEPEGGDRHPSPCTMHLLSKTASLLKKLGGG